MNALVKFLIKNNYIELTPEKVEKWFAKHNDQMLIFAYENGIYNVRKRAVECMAERDNEDLFPFIEHAIDDRIMQVSLTAIEILMQSDLSDELLEQIESKSEFWLEKTKARKKVAYKRANAKRR